MKRFSRRHFGKLASMLAAACPLLPAETQTVAVENSAAFSCGRFPRHFIWGTSTAAYQIEGAAHEDGRGASIWDTFSHEAGKTNNGDNGDFATDSYHRYPEDIAIMKELGLTGCRFSIAWTRIFPEGAGQPNQQGVDHYRRLADALLRAGLEPFCTLYHWDLPQALQDKGGWQNKQTAEAFAHYAGYTAGQLGDLIKTWITTNEIASFIEIGYGKGRHAPGMTLDPRALAQTKHNAVLGHGLAVQAIRAAAPKAKIGCAEGPIPVVPAYRAPEHIAAARIAFKDMNAAYLNVMYTGAYEDSYLRRLGPDAPVFTAEELKIISSPTDFQGLNIYDSVVIRASDNAQGYVEIPRPISYPHMESPWLYIGPQALYWVPKLTAEVWGVKQMYITENGCSCADVMAPNNEVYDTDRVMFLNAYLTQLQKCVNEGVPVKGYFLWSLLDNYEWADGYNKRFGITYVDFGTQKRTPKLSAKFYKALIARGYV